MHDTEYEPMFFGDCPLGPDLCLPVIDDPGPPPSPFDTAQRVQLTHYTYSRVINGDNSRYYYFNATITGQKSINFSAIQHLMHVEIYDNNRQLRTQSTIISRELIELSFHVNQGSKYYIVV